MKSRRVCGGGEGGGELELSGTNEKKKGSEGENLAWRQR